MPVTKAQKAPIAKKVNSRAPNETQGANAYIPPVRSTHISKKKTYVERKAAQKKRKTLSWLKELTVYGLLVSLPLASLFWFRFNDTDAFVYVRVFYTTFLLLMSLAVGSASGDQDKYIVPCQLSSIISVGIMRTNSASWEAGLPTIAYAFLWVQAIR